MAPYTLTFEEIPSNDPSAAGSTGRPRRFPTTSGRGPVCCCAIVAVGTAPITSAAAPVRIMIGFIDIAPSVWRRRTPPTEHYRAELAWRDRHTQLFWRARC